MRFKFFVLGLLFWNLDVLAGNIKDVSSSFNTLLGSPTLQQYKELKSIAGKAYRFAAKVVPYGEAISAVLKILADNDDVVEVLKVSKQIDSKIDTIRSEQAKFKEEIIRYHLKSTYYDRVTEPLKQMFQLLSSINSYDFKPPADKLRAFVDGCNIRYSPQSISSYLQSVAVGCGEAVINSKLISQIYTKLQNHNYITHHQPQSRDDNETEKWFGIHVAAIYFKLLPMSEFEREKAFLKLERLINSNTLHKFSGLYSIKNELGDGSMRGFDQGEACLAKTLFISTNFKSSKLLKFAANILQDYNSTIVLGVICANVTNPDNKKAADLETNFVLKDLERVSIFLSTWFSQLMNSTWTEIDSIVVSNEIKKQAGILGIIPRNTNSYNLLRDNIANALKDIGHPIYTRQFVIFPALELDFRPSHIKFGCKTGTCTEVLSHKLHVFLVRTSLDSDDFTANMDVFNNFVRSNSQNFIDGMEDMWSELPAYIIEHLRIDYNFDVDSMTHNSFYLMFSTFSRFNVCRLIYSTHAYQLDNKQMLFELPYHTTSSWTPFTPRCVTHTLILVV